MKKRTYRKLIIILLCLTVIWPQGLLLDSLQVLAATTGIITATSLNVRSGPGTDYDKVKVNGSYAYLKQDDKVTIEDEENGWYVITFKFSGKNVKGYVLKDYVKAESETVKTTPSDGAPTKTQTPTKTPTQTPTQTTPTKTPTKTPTVSDTNIKDADFTIPATVNATSLNVRKSPSTSSSKITSLSSNAEVIILNEKIMDTGKWYRISALIKDKTYTGYVLSDYVILTLKSKVKANVSSSSKVKIRTEAGTKSKYITNKSHNQVALSNGKSIYIINEVTDSSGDKWFKITFTVSNVSYSGYIPAEKVLFRVTTVDSTPTPPVKNGDTTAPTDKPTPETPASPTPIPAQDIKVINTPTEANIYISSQIFFNAGGSDLYKDGAGNPILLPVKQKVTIYDTITNNMVTWYFIETQLNSISYYGYVKAENVLTNTSNEVEVPPSNQVLTDAEFEAEMTKQGFPNSYKSLLKQLHQQHPTWIFEAYQTGLDWNTVMEREGAVGINLLSNGKSIEWKSTEQGAYNWKTDKFVPYDGSTWVTSSKEATAYYMDPRNFIDEKGIFQFELLSYNKGYQSVSGVEGILFNTPLYNCNYTYVNNEGNQDTISYAETFIDAAEYSGVSPYHLAARVKQEVVTGITSLSSSVSGTVKDLEGLFNFYNIGAFNSTAPGGAVANGLKYAKNGTTSQELNLLYRIPWDSPYDSIVGGAYIIGRNYINKGQNTIYMQKFNVTPTSTFSHQYMANVEAPSAEAKKTYTAYSGMMDVPIVFSVPVYLNMPETISPMPVKKYNPNNWLKTLEVDGYSISPTFDLTIDQPYDLTVENTTEFINISAIPVSTKATVTGIGTIPLQIGNNSLVITVTAENGDNRNYTINVVRELQ